MTALSRSISLDKSLRRSVSDVQWPPRLRFRGDVLLALLLLLLLECLTGTDCTSWLKLHASPLRQIPLRIKNRHGRLLEWEGFSVFAGRAMGLSTLSGGFSGDVG